MKNKKAFSFIELIIVISLLALLAIVGMSYQGASNQKAKNTRITADLETLNNSILSYKEAEKTLPEPKGNKNFFSSTGTYEHDNTNAFGVHGFVTDDLLPKKYLNYLPLDPRTNQFYAYGKTKDNKSYEVSGVVNIDGEYQTKLQGNYTAENGPYSLIREYNGPAFVSDKSKTHFPYNPTERQLVGKISNISGTVKINGSTANILTHTLVSGDTIEVSAGGKATIFFSDGSQSLLGDNSHTSKLKLDNLEFKSKDNLLTRIQLTLESGILWTKATNLNSEGAGSDFEVSAQDITAAVRGTIFGVENNAGNVKVYVLKGKVEILKKSDKSHIKDLTETQNNYNGTIPFSTFPQTVQNYLTGSTIAPSNFLSQAEQYAQQAIPKTLTGTTTTYCPSYDENQNGGDTSCICETGKSLFEIDGKRFCEYKVNGMELYAFAPYDNCKSTIPNNDYGTAINNLFKNQIFKLNIKNGNSKKGNSNFGIQNIIGSWNWQQMCNGDEGFTIDNLGNEEYLYYTGLELEDKFTIKMKAILNGAADGTNAKFIFNLNGNKLYIISGKIFFKKDSSTIEYVNFTPNSNLYNINVNFDNNFTSNEINISGNNITLNINDFNNINNGDKIFIGSKEIGVNKNIGGKIDYFKIYNN